MMVWVSGWRCAGFVLGASASSLMPPSSASCIDADSTGKLAYVPGVFSVERHLRRHWLCRQCEHFTQKEMPPPHIIDKGIAAPGLLAHVLVGVQVWRSPAPEPPGGISPRQGVTLPISTLSNWLG